MDNSYKNECFQDAYEIHMVSKLLNVLMTYGILCDVFMYGLQRRSRVEVFNLGFIDLAPLSCSSLWHPAE